MRLLAQSLPKGEQNKKGRNKGKSGQALKIAVSGGFGGGILSRNNKQALTLLGERSGACDAVEGATIAELLIDVLTGLGGASQEKSAARNFFWLDLRASAEDSDVIRAFSF